MDQPSPCLLQNFYEKPAFDYPLNQMSVWLMLGNEGMERESNDSFCAPTPSAMVFGRSDGDRVAVTRDLALRQGYTLQFKVLSTSQNVKKKSQIKSNLFRFFSPASVEHRLRVGVQRRRARPPAVLARRRPHLGPSEGGLLPRDPWLGHVRGQRPRAPRAQRLQHGRLRAVDQGHRGHPAQRGSQVGRARRDAAAAAASLCSSLTCVLFVVFQ